MTKLIERLRNCRKSYSVDTLLRHEAADRITELEALVISSYQEGWIDGRNTTSVSGHEVDWVVSGTKSILEEVVDEED